MKRDWDARIDGSIADKTECGRSRAGRGRAAADGAADGIGIKSTTGMGEEMDQPSGKDAAWDTGF